MTSLFLNKKKRPQGVFFTQLVIICSLATLNFSANAGDVADKFRSAFIGDNQPVMNASAEHEKTRGITINATSHLPSDKLGKLGSGCMARAKSVALKINFRHNSKNIQNPADIVDIADSMNSDQLADCYFIVEGHTDALGNDYYNLWLSQKRAEEVKQYLSRNNVDEDRLIVVGKGEDELINQSIPNAAENRRVVFKVVNYDR
jgi:hypothetical protein